MRPARPYFESYAARESLWVWDPWTRQIFSHPNSNLVIRNTLYQPKSFVISGVLYHLALKNVFVSSKFVINDNVIIRYLRFIRICTMWKPCNIVNLKRILPEVVLRLEQDSFEMAKHIGTLMKKGNLLYLKVIFLSWRQKLKITLTKLGFNVSKLGKSHDIPYVKLHFRRVSQIDMRYKSHCRKHTYELIYLT